MIKILNSDYLSSIILLIFPDYEITILQKLWILSSNQFYLLDFIAWIEKEKLSLLNGA